MNRHRLAPLVAVARYTVVDLMRSRWRPMIAAMLAIGVAISLFAGQLALTERDAVVVSLAAPVLRILCVLLVMALVIAALVREIGDRTHLMALAAPIARGGWIAAKLAGFTTISAMTAAASGAVLWLLAPPGAGPAAAAWTVSLAMELAICAAIAMTVALALRQVPVALLAAAGVYVAARLIGVIQRINAHSPAGEGTAAGDAMALPLGVLGALLPRLDLFARTDWLTGAPVDGFWAMPLQAALYLVLMATVAAFDYRKRDA